jgi:uncharacterized spore protein YtfJ
MTPGNGSGTPSPSADQSFLSSMADRFGTNARAEAVYAPAVTQDGITVIPVAKVRWGFGGGNGVRSGSEAEDGSGGGGGGGMIVKPIGYLELKKGRSKFRPIRDPSSTAGAVLAAGIAATLILKALRRLIDSLD